MPQNPNLIADSGLGTPAADVEVNEVVLHKLLEAQFPDLSKLPLKMASSGWDNCMIRIGQNLCARMPRRRVANQLIINEQEWLPKLAPFLPLEVPVAQFIGAPGQSYPYSWSIVKWLKGVQACDTEIDSDQAAVLVDFLKALHKKAPKNAPESDCRGIPLIERADLIEDRLIRLQASRPGMTARLMPIWQAALEAEIDTKPTWLHGDLHPRNVLVDGGKISAAIDWGDMCTGDIATDLAAIWFLLNDKKSREDALMLYGASAPTIARAKGWALSMGIILLETGMHDNSVNFEIGDQIIENILRS